MGRGVEAGSTEQEQEQAALSSVHTAKAVGGGCETDCCPAKGREPHALLWVFAQPPPLSATRGSFLASPSSTPHGPLFPPTATRGPTPAPPEGHLVGAKEADLEVAVRHDPQPVAVGAEGAGHAGDEGHAAGKAGDLRKGMQGMQSNKQHH